MIDASNFKHDLVQKKTAVILVNLGTPSKPNASSLRKYLREFLWDRRVVEIPRVLWWIILNFIILTIRPRKSAKLYQSIWTEKGSPLAVYTQNLTNKLQNKFGEELIIDYAMRYGDENIPKKLNEMAQRGFIENLLVIPLYPQYSATTTASVFDAISTFYKSQRFIPNIKFLTHYHDRRQYIGAIAKSISNYQDQFGVADKLLFSFHGIPKRNLELGDPYYCECMKTSRLVKETLKLSDEQLVVSFQSRFGKAEWLKPYTSEELLGLGKQGVSVQVVCPGFAVDCLETLEEIKVENCELFKEAGGKNFEYISCLNDTDIHIEMFYDIVSEEIGQWKQA
jgi:protoporphyrin/coproporphyrin ferrochelatase